MVTSSENATGRSITQNLRVLRPKYPRKYLTVQRVDEEMVSGDGDAVPEIQHGVGQPRGQEYRLAGPLHELDHAAAVQLEVNKVHAIASRVNLCLDVPGNSPSSLGAVATRAGTSAKSLN